MTGGYSVCTENKLIQRLWWFRRTEEIERKLSFGEKYKRNKSGFDAAVSLKTSCF